MWNIVWYIFKSIVIISGIFLFIVMSYEYFSLGKEPSLYWVMLVILVEIGFLDNLKSK